MAEEREIKARMRRLEKARAAEAEAGRQAVADYKKRKQLQRDATIKLKERVERLTAACPPHQVAAANAMRCMRCGGKLTRAEAQEAADRKEAT